MLLSTKHANQQLVNRYDFAGGLNSTVAVEMIADNQLFEVVNMEPDPTTGLLKTVDGTEIMQNVDFDLFSAAYDRINKVFILFSTETEIVSGATLTVHNIYTSDLSSTKKVGKLSGDLIPVCFLWESGLLIASGGYLQYYNGTNLLTITAVTTTDASMWKEVNITVYTPNETYAIGDVVKNDTAYYVCKVAHTAIDITTDASRWTLLNYLSTWKQKNAYAVNDMVMAVSSYYVCKVAHTSSEDAPSVCDCGFVRDARIIVSTGDNNELRYSGTGDETNWKQDDNDASASKFVETGYKDGGKFIGMVNLTSDIILIKGNGYVYRLDGTYPNWSMSSISHEIDCDGRLSFCALTNTVMILGSNTIQMLDTTQDYSNMKATNIAANVANELKSLPNAPHMVYLPPLNQVWILGTKGKVIVYDCTHKSFFIRKFNSEIIGVFHAINDVVIIKKNGIVRLKSRSFTDAGLNLKWRFRAKRLVSQHDFLLKRVQVNITPYFEGYSNNTITVGGLTMELPVPYSVYQVYNNYSYIYNNQARIYGDYGKSPSCTVGDKIYDNNELIYENERLIYAIANLSKESRCVYRNKSIDIRGVGNGGNFILNSINFDVAEV